MAFEPALPAEIFLCPIEPAAPLIIVDVDEVLAMFVRGFERFVGRFGLEMRLTRYALLQSIFRAQDAEPVALARGRELFDAFFETDVEDIEPAPGAAEALAGFAARASVVILTNAPGHSRQARARWLIKHGFPYPLIVGAGLKGPAVAALAARTSGPAAFVDDLLVNLESAATEAPAVRRFQMVADERLRSLAPCAPQRHMRCDEWPALRGAISAALDLPE